MGIVEKRNGTQFLLTRLLRGVTSRMAFAGSARRISTHTPLARRDHMSPQESGVYDISTHTPLARRDSIENMIVRLAQNFYSHTSCEA